MYESGADAGTYPEAPGVVAPPSPPPYRIWTDAAGTIRVHMHGLWAVETVAAYMQELEERADEVRGRGHPVRVVVDVREAPVWRKPVAALMTERNRTFYRAGDRLALILHSSLSKVQARQQIVDEHQALFLSPTAADLWISATMTKGARTATDRRLSDR